MKYIALIKGQIYDGAAETYRPVEAGEKFDTPEGWVPPKMKHPKAGGRPWAIPLSEYKELKKQEEEGSSLSDKVAMSEIGKPAPSSRKTVL